MATQTYQSDILFHRRVVFWKINKTVIDINDNERGMLKGMLVDEKE